MEPEFINQYEITLERYLQWAKHPVGKAAVRAYKKGIRLRIMMVCLGIFIVLDGIFLREFFLALSGFIFAVIGLSRLFILPGKIQKRQYALILKSQNTDHCLRKVTFSDEIVCEEGNNLTRYAYSDIIRVTEDSVYFYLFYNEDMVLRVDKESFVVGNAAAFREFCSTYMVPSVPEKGGILQKDKERRPSVYEDVTKETEKGE